MMTHSRSRRWLLLLLPLSAVAGVVVWSLACAPANTASRLARQESSQASLADRDAEAVALAQKALKSWDASGFTGTIDFDLTLISGSHPDSAPTEQIGRLYHRSSGQVRLDIWCGTPESAPVVCSVQDGMAWMIFGESPLAVHAPFPMQGFLSGWAGQMQAQAQQTVSFARTLLCADLDTPLERSLEAAELSEGRLTLRLGACAGDPRGPVEIQAEYRSDLQAYCAKEIKYLRDGSLITFEGHFRVDDQHVIAEVVSLADANGSSITWSITDVQPLVPEEDAGLFAAFDIPSDFSDLYPELGGVRILDRVGKESRIVVWN